MPKVAKQKTLWSVFEYRLRRRIRRLGYRLRRTPIIVSFPKSGRTWLRVMLDQLGIRAEYSHRGASVKRGAHFDDLTALPAKYGARAGLFLLRDPRDTAISGYFQASKRARVYDGSLSAYIRDPGQGVEKVARFNLMWVEALASRPNFAIVEYEALHRDTAGLLAAAARHLGAAPSAQSIARAVAAARFATMQEGERSGAYQETYRNILAPRIAGDADSFKVRRGVVGGYADYLNADDQAYCDEVLTRLDYARRLAQGLRQRGLGREVETPQAFAAPARGTTQES